MILPRALFGDSPPERRTRLADNPTLLYSWWCTIFSAVIIITRLVGRFVRNNRLFTEDKIMAWSLIPLLARMACAHVVLIYGTNNVDTRGLTDPLQISNRELGSQMVLAARIFYALFIWMAKFTVSEFLKRMTDRFWKRSYEFGLQGIRIFLFVTFISVVIATLSECQPFTHYWQVIPDPGPRCRQGYAHLLTMGVTDIITDLLLVFFPIPIILRSGMGFKRKMSLVALFSLSISLIAITGARIPLVIQRHGSQQFRTVFASSEIIAATMVSNAIILGSFLRDRGPKKPKYKPSSTTDSMDRRSSIRRTPLNRWGSDEDLARSLGYRTNPELLDDKPTLPRPAPVVDLRLLSPADPSTPFSDSNWQFPQRRYDMSQSSGDSDLKPMALEDSMPSPRGAGGRRVSFFDVGGLLEAGPLSSVIPSPTDSVVAHDFATQPHRGSRPSNPLLANGRAYTPYARQSSRLSLQSEDFEMTVRPHQQLTDLRSFLSEGRELEGQEQADASQPAIVRSPTGTSYGSSLPSLQDAGGLLCLPPFPFEMK